MSLPSAALIELLRCPETRQRLELASEEVIARARGLGSKEPFEAGLLREDGRLFFPIRRGLPILLLDEAIRLGDGAVDC